MRYAPVVLAFLTALPGPALPVDDVQREMAAAREISGRLLTELGAALKQAMASGGPEAAIGVCRDAAPQIAARLSRESGARVTRVSLKARNPMLGQPDPWEQQALADFDARAAAGEQPAALELGGLVDEPAGRYFRYVKAIPVQPLCLACHGSPEAIAPAVRDRLAADYPHDRAYGYTMGQIRGAVSVKMPTFR